jgi:hypothetical protein
MDDVVQPLDDGHNTVTRSATQSVMHAVGWREGVGES